MGAGYTEAHQKNNQRDPATSRLVETLGNDGALEFQELRSGLSIQSYSFVGSLTIGAIRVVVLPKLRGMQLMRLLRTRTGSEN
jgi:hypothetical protein